MRKSPITLAILAATISSIAHAGAFPAANSDCPTTGVLAAADAGSKHLLRCIDHKWVDPATLDHVTVKLDAKVESSKAGSPRWALSQTGLVGAPVSMAISNQSSYITSNAASEVTVGTVETGVAATVTVVSLNPDRTAHVKADIDTTKVSGLWRKHIDLNVPVGQKTAIAKDDDGMEYAITVDKLAS
jgi:hypothetical protein